MSSRSRLTSRVSAPAIAPVIGGWLQGAFGWRAVFVFLVVYSALLLLACQVRLRETLPAGERQPFRLAPLAANYGTLGRSALANPALPWSILPIMIYTTGMALAMPSLTLRALDLFPKNRGLAASLVGFEHSFVSAIAAGVVSAMLSHSDIALALGMAGFVSAGWLFWMLYARRERRSGRAAA